jgi:hypothetical protein
MEGQLLRKASIWVVIPALLGTAVVARAGEGSPRSAGPAPAIDFDRQVRPILSNNCFRCHGPDEEVREAGLRLDVRDEALAPADSGKPAIVPGRPGESTLVRRTSSKDKRFMMPPPRSNKTLTQAEITLLRTWVEQGAKYQTHWSFAPPQRPQLPPVKDAAWPRNPIDRFILARLEAEGLRPSAEADRPTLIRRLTLDLTGLPPTAAEVNAFLDDPGADAYERLVDRLLASPHYGERMSLDWLDAARFADTHGYHIDSARDMTRWREWVIQAFNSDMPFDRFTVEQLAGDLLPAPTLAQKVASGFNRNHMITYEGGAIPEEYLTAYIVDRVNTTGTVWLGLTVGCTQCHDHKFDPMTQKEYYRLYAFFNNVPEQGLDGRKGNAAPAIPAPSPAQQEALDGLAESIRDAERELDGPMSQADLAQERWDKEFRADGPKGPNATNKPPEAIARILALPPVTRTDPQRAELRKYYRTHVSKEARPLAERLARLRKERDGLRASIPTAMVMQETGSRPTFMLIRGQYDKHGEKVTAGVPAFLPPLPEGMPVNRLALARWLVAPNHPLVSRVTVNRFWQTFFGTGLVKTAEDFGSQGEPPSHRELLDWLAVEFMRPGTDRRRPWDVKALVRLIVTSATYRQSSAVTAELVSKDPENRLLARGPRVRLPAEFIRDQALAVSGLLDRRLGGTSVSPYQPAGLWEELMSRADGKNFTAQTYVQSHGRDLYRRTMYTFWKRTSPPPSLITFDAPDRETCTVRRARTNTPLQALVLMNDPTYVEASRKLAERMMCEGGPTPGGRIAFAFRATTARHPTDDETRQLNSLFDRELAVYRADKAAALKMLSVGESPRAPELDVAELAAWSTVAGVILNLDETVTKG